jgi:catechol 2,3-dioxygenase-like lactoylglutathione lyase family enzyme
MELGLVTMLVDDYDTAITFFVDAVGFVLLEDSPIDGAKRWVVVAPAPDRGHRGAGLLLARASDDAQRHRVGDQTGGRVGFFLHTGDFAGDHARMLAAGVQFVEAPREEPYGTVAVFLDCCGNRWDLIEHRR